MNQITTGYSSPSLLTISLEIVWTFIHVHSQSLFSGCVYCNCLKFHRFPLMWSCAYKMIVQKDGQQVFNENSFSEKSHFAHSLKNKNVNGCPYIKPGKDFIVIYK